MSEVSETSVEKQSETSYFRQQFETWGLKGIARQLQIAWHDRYDVGQTINLNEDSNISWS
jgi:hypothetical protein